MNLQSQSVVTSPNRVPVDDLQQLGTPISSQKLIEQTVLQFDLLKHLVRIPEINEVCLKALEYHQNVTSQISILNAALVADPEANTSGLHCSVFWHSSSYGFPQREHDNTALAAVGLIEALASVNFSPNNRYFNTLSPESPEREVWRSVADLNRRAFNLALIALGIEKSLPDASQGQDLLSDQENRSTRAQILAIRSGMWSPEEIRNHLLSPKLNRNQIDFSTLWGEGAVPVITAARIIPKSNRYIILPAHVSSIGERTVKGEQSFVGSGRKPADKDLAEKSSLLRELDT